MPARKFECLGDQTAVEWEASDHEPLVAHGILSANILYKMRGDKNTGSTNNGFCKQEDQDDKKNRQEDYRLRLKKLAEMLAEIVNGPADPRLDVIALQEIPLPTPPFLPTDVAVEFFRYLQKLLPDFDVESLILQPTGAGSKKPEEFGQCLICRRGFELNQLDEPKTTPENQIGRIVCAELIDPKTKKVLRKVGNVHLKYDSAEAYDDPSKAPETTRYLNDLMADGISLAGDFNRNAPGIKKASFDKDKEKIELATNVAEALTPVGTSLTWDKAQGKGIACSVDGIFMSKHDPYILDLLAKKDIKNPPKDSKDSKDSELGKDKGAAAASSSKDDKKTSGALDHKHSAASQAASKGESPGASQGKSSAGFGKDDKTPIPKKEQEAQKEEGSQKEQRSQKEREKNAKEHQNVPPAEDEDYFEDDDQNQNDQKTKDEEAFLKQQREAKKSSVLDALKLHYKALREAASATRLVDLAVKAAMDWSGNMQGRTPEKYKEETSKLAGLIHQKYSKMGVECQYDNKTDILTTRIPHVEDYPGGSTEDQLIRSLDHHNIPKVTLSNPPDDVSINIMLEMNGDIMPLKMTQPCGDELIAIKLLEASLISGRPIELHPEDIKMLQDTHDAKLNARFHYLESLKRGNGTHLKTLREQVKIFEATKGAGSWQLGLSDIPQNVMKSAVASWLSFEGAGSAPKGEPKEEPKGKGSKRT